MADSLMVGPVPCRHDPPKEMSADNSANTASGILEPIKGVEKQRNLSEVKPGGPSWNDPPVVKFYYGCSNPSSGNLKHIKRVGKTGADIDPSISEPPNASLKDDEKSSSIDTDQVPDNEKKDFIVDTFKEILLKPTWDEQKNTKDIEKRLNMLEQSWEKLSPDVKQNMYKLTQELAGGQIDKALKIQCHLMVHHVREVKNWMVAVKHLISMKEELLGGENVNRTSSDSNT